MALPVALTLLLATPALPGPGSDPPASSSGQAASEATRGSVLAVVGGLLVDGTGAEPIPDSAIIIEDGRIMAAGPRRETRIPPGAAAVDATDRTVIPGLIDMHVHLVPALDPGEFLRYGVTSVRHMGNTTIEWIAELKDAVDSGRVRGPRIFHAGRFVVSQPPLDPSNFPDGEIDHYSVIHDKSEIPAIIDELVRAGAELVKVKAHMDPALLPDLCAAAQKAGLPVAFDALGGSSFNALDALRAGAVGVEHLGGIDFASPHETEMALRKMLQTGAYAVPTFAVLERTFSDGRLETSREFVRSFHRRGGTVLAGSDAPSRGTPPGESLHEELGYLVAAGLTPRDALRAASGAAGRALGYQGRIGTIETGAWADLVILRGMPLERIAESRLIEKVFKGGVQAWPPAGAATH